jgi:phosphoglycerate dehydrogenase-like enzyme/tRNA A-37 threonylcarbamoyl transferase component Bud32
MPGRAGLRAPGPAEVLLTDFPWGDTEIEERIIGEAGLGLVLGSSVSGTRQEIERLVEEHDPIGILTWRAPLSSRAVRSPSDLRIIARFGIDLDRIDVEAATARGTWVTNVPDYCAEELSDQALALLLAQVRGILAHKQNAKTGRCGDRTCRENKRLCDLAVGIVGFGPIGRATMRKLAGFECRILINDPLLEPAGVYPVDLTTLQAESDAIVLHLPLMQQTRHLVDDTFIRACKRRPVLINVSHGDVVDPAALIRGLESGVLSGAALAAVEGETSAPPMLLGRADIITTTHLAWSSSNAAIGEVRRRACEELVRVLRGEWPRNPCNRPEVGTPLAGGIASDIRIISVPKGDIVVKTALPKLKVAAEWLSDPARSATEVAALQAIGDLLGSDVVPRVLWSDPAQHRFAMQRVDPKLRNWKQELLAGRVNLLTAARVGELLGLLHSRSAARCELAERFADDTYFQQLRVAPYLHRIAIGNPNLGAAISEVIEGLAQRRQALVHGDYSPKNILADGKQVVILDCEVAHWGDPRFDIGFVLAHLLLKALRHGADTAPLVAAGDALLEAYQRCGLPVLDVDLVRTVGCLVLARLEGDSPIDYLGEIDSGFAKKLAVGLITNEPIAAPTIMHQVATGRQ